MSLQFDVWLWNAFGEDFFHVQAKSIEFLQ